MSNVRIDVILEAISNLSGVLQESRTGIDALIAQQNANTESAERAAAEQARLAKALSDATLQQTAQTTAARQAEDQHDSLTAALDEAEAQQDQLNSALDQGATKQDQLTRANEDAATKQDRLTRSVDKADSSARNHIQTIGKWAIGIAAAVSAIVTVDRMVGGLTGIFQLGADMSRASIRTSVTTQDLLVMGSALTSVGIDANEVGQIINDMQERISDGARGMGEGLDAFALLRVDLQQIKTLDPVSQFELLADRINRLKDPADRAAASMQIFGESGVRLMPLFADGGAIDDARQSLGALPDILSRNADEFNRIEVLLTRLPTKSQQFFAGLGDLIGTHVVDKLEEINRIDLTAAGQRVGAFVHVAIDAWQAGQFASLIGLTIEAGFELGMGAAADFVSDYSVPVSAMIMQLGVEFGEMASDALGYLSLFSAYVTSGFEWAWEVAREGASTLVNGFQTGFATAVNTFAGGIEAAINAAIDALRVLPGLSNVAAVSIHRMTTPSDEDIFRAREYGDILAETQAEVVARADERREALRASLAESLSAIGLETTATEEQGSAVERLNALIEQQIALRETLQGPAPDDPVARANGPSLGIEVDPVQDFINQMESLQDVGQATADILQNSFMGIRSTIEDLLNNTISWRQALTSIPAVILGAVISSFATMAAAWITQKAAMLIFDMTADQTRAASAASTAVASGAVTAAAGATAAGAWIPAAIAASIATFGAASVAGGAGFATAMMSGVAVASAAALIGGTLTSVLGGIGSAIGGGLAAANGSRPGYRTGGRVYGGQQTITVNEDEEEYVMSGPATRRNSAFLDVLNRTASVDAAMAATGRGGRSGASGDSAVFHAVGSPRDARKFRDRYPGDVLIRRMMREELASAR